MEAAQLAFEKFERRWAKASEQSADEEADGDNTECVCLLCTT